jgi:hypothetical protein
MKTLGIALYGIYKWVVHEITKKWLYFVVVYHFSKIFLFIPYTKATSPRRLQNYFSSMCDFISILPLILSLIVILIISTCFRKPYENC